MIRGLHHVALNTADLPRLQAFYVDIIGFEVVDRAQWENSDVIDSVVGLKGSKARQVMMRAGNCYVEIFEYQAPAARAGEPLRPCDLGYTHLCLDVVDIEAEYDRLTAAGVRFNRRPGDFGDLKAVYGKDPDGNVIEIQEVLSKAVPFHPARLDRLDAAQAGPKDPVKMLHDLNSREEIRQVIYLYCRALDRCDEALLRSVFHPDSTHSHGPYQGPSDAFCGFAMDLLHTLVSTQHHLGNIIIDLDGDLAHTESYWVAYHHVAAGVSLPGIMADHNPAFAEDLFIGGRYIDRFERRNGVWKIAHRTGVHDWQRWEKADERSFRQPASGILGSRDKNDPVYQMAKNKP